MRLAYKEIENGSLAFTRTLGGMPDKQTMYKLGAYQVGFENGFSDFLKNIKGKDMRSLDNETIARLEEARKVSFILSFIEGVNPPDLMNDALDSVLEILEKDPSRIRDKELLQDDRNILNKGKISISQAIGRELCW